MKKSIPAGGGQWTSMPSGGSCDALSFFMAGKPESMAGLNESRAHGSFDRVDWTPAVTIQYEMLLR